MLNIQITWVYFLGIMGALILVAWYSNGRFTALEISMTWLKENLNDLKVGAENSSSPTPAFGSSSPVNLKPIGEQWLSESGLKDYIEENRQNLMEICEEKNGTNPYEVQNHIFRVFDALPLESGFEDKLEKFAYEKGSSMSILRRIGAIHFRNLCIDEFGMNREDIDKHDPEVKDDKIQIPIV
jgi:hypothetical protein